MHCHFDRHLCFVAFTQVDHACAVPLCLRRFTTNSVAQRRAAQQPGVVQPVTAQSGILAWSRVALTRSHASFRPLPRPWTPPPPVDPTNLAVSRFRPLDLRINGPCGSSVFRGSIPWLLTRRLRFLAWITPHGQDWLPAAWSRFAGQASACASPARSLRMISVRRFTSSFLPHP